MRLRRSAVLALLAGCGVLLVSCREMVKARHTQEPVLATSVASGEAEALDLRERAAAAARSVPLSGRLVIERRGADGHSLKPTTIDVMEGYEGRFRYTYRSPDVAAGRVVIGDGSTVWQYEPRTRVVLRVTNIAPLDDLPKPEAGTRFSIEPGAATAAERAARVLLTRDPEGRIVERRWIDAQTNRSLRVEQYDASGRILRRMEMKSVDYTPVTKASVFRPAFPADAHVQSARAHRAADTVGEARRLYLPPTAGQYRLRSVVQAHPLGPRLTSESRHLLYSDGEHTISVFVTEGDDKNEKARLSPGDTWRPVSLGRNVAGFARDDTHGRAAAAWTSDGNRYIAVARLPLKDLLTVTRTLASRAGNPRD